MCQPLEYLVVPRGQRSPPISAPRNPLSTLWVVPNGPSPLQGEGSSEGMFIVLLRHAMHELGYARARATVWYILVRQ